MNLLRGHLTVRQFYALIWKDFVVHKRHYIWTMLEITIPVLVCAMAILSDNHQGKPRLENERTFEPDDYDRLYGDLNPNTRKILVAPNSSFTRALVDQIDDGVVSIELCETERDLLELIRQETPVKLNQISKLIPSDNKNKTITGIVINTDEAIVNRIYELNQASLRSHNSSKQTDTIPIIAKNSYYYEVNSKLDGRPMRIPTNFDMTIRASTFRLGPEAFPKKNSLAPFFHSDHYVSTFFMASQIMFSRAYINLLANYVYNETTRKSIVIPTNEDIIGQRMPYPKYVTQRRLRETTLGQFVAGSQKQKPFVLTMDYCITLGFLVTAIFLAKRLVDERKSRVRDMLRLVGISDWTYYGSHMCNTMIIMLMQCFIITLLFTGLSEAPAQNVDKSLFFFFLLLYSLAAVMFVFALSASFKSSTKAIIITSLLWFGLPELLDRVFKLNSGIVESNGFLLVDEHIHLLFCLVPNFGLKLMNRLLTECNIYGEFYAKKDLYGEYRAVWPNLFHTLPLYKWLTLGHLASAFALSVPLYACLIYMINSLLFGSGSVGGLTALSSDDFTADKSNYRRPSLYSPFNFIINLLVTPIRQLLNLIKNSSKSSDQTENGTRVRTPSWSVANLNQANPNVVLYEGAGKPVGAYLNAAYTHSTHQSLVNLSSDSNLNKQQLANNIELGQIESNKSQHKLSIGKQDHLKSGNNDSQYFETAPGMLNIGVSIKNLCKSYYTSSSVRNRIDAVRNVSLDMFYSQILVLLGHNGAGKTTLIDIISGHNQKSSGSVLIDGYDIDENPREARRQVGFCPQFDVLFERLTVEEHLYFYGIVKGAIDELSDEIEQLLIQSGLNVHRKKLSKTLSGGYKRKLSLAIAMIAKSKVLILDEPTSGMDPESRRKVWDFLQLIRHDRLILMTTHHMEEADALGDRIAVMSGGQVKCCGSALFLKRVFNAGYHLRISKGANWSQAAFDDLICSKFDLQDKLENATPHELMYKFDAGDTPTLLPALFDELDQNRERTGIFGFGITVSTMDDVFMKIGLHFKDLEAQELQSKLELQAKSLLSNSRESPTSSNLSFSPIASTRKLRLHGFNLFEQQLRALLTKRYQHARKNHFQLLWILFISLACVASVVALMDMVIFKEELLPEWSHEMTLPGAGYGKNTKAVYQYTKLGESSTSTSPFSDEAIVAPTSDPTNYSEMISLSSSSLPSTNISNSTITSLTNSETHTTPGPSEVTTSAILGRFKRQALDDLARVNATNDSAMFLQKYWLPEAQRSGTNGLLTYTDINSQMIELLTRQFADFRDHYIVGGEKSGKKYVAWYSGEAIHSLPISMNIMLNSILKQFTDLIQDEQHPLKGSRISLKHEALSQINTHIAFLPQLGRLINLIFLPFSLAFITSYFVIFPTHERVTKSKHLQLMTGVSARTFWLSHFIFDFILYTTYSLAVLIIYFVWDRVINDRRIYFANLDHSIALVSLVTLYIFGALPLVYIFSFVAKKPASGFSSLCVLTILTGTATLILISLYELKYELTASATLKIVFHIFLWTSRLIPSVSLLVGLQKLFALNTTRSLCLNVSPEVLDTLCRFISSPIVDEELRNLRPERCCKKNCGDECFDQWPFFWTGWFGINTELAMLVLDAVLFWSILVIIESRSIRQSVWRFIDQISMQPFRWLCLLSRRTQCTWQVPQFNGTNSAQEPNDHEKASKPRDGQKPDQFSLVAQELTKVYSSNHVKAVDRLSFNVHKSEFFGLLGVNGAGKSSTFKMLTGELDSSSGTAWIGSYDVRNQRRQYLKQIGYCPQQDALIDHLTGNQMLGLFARLRGIPEQSVDAAVDDALEKLGLTKIGHIECQNYSGGNKRRLSVGMALIGAPQVIFLDEPTSGVDPRSRRRLWSTLIEFQQQTKCSIVMTSHSMNECECLCDRVAIMVGGQFKVLGSIQYLRTKLSQGFSLILKLKPDNLNQLQDLTKSTEVIHDYMKKNFSSSEIKLKDLHQTIIQYHIEPSQELTWSKMLVQLEQAKQELDLEDYQITSDASLESIFLSLAKQDGADAELVKA